MNQTINVGLIVSNERLKQELRGAFYTLPVRLAMEARADEWAAAIAKVEETQPDIVMLELATVLDNLADSIRQIKAATGTPMVVLVHENADSEMVLQAIRTNADEYVYPPFGEDLARALQKLAAERVKSRAGTRPRGKVAGVLSSKGGCGATTLACHVAVAMAKQTGLEILLADFDVDSGNVGFLMKSQARYSVLDALDNVHRLDTNYWKAIVSNGIPGLEVVRSHNGLPAFKERNLDEFAQVLRFTRSAYDWAIVDLGRSLSRLTMTVLTELDEVLLVTTPDIPALHQAKNIVQLLSETGYPADRIRLVLNRSSQRSDVTLEELEKMLGTKLYYALPDQSPELYEALANGGLLTPETNLGKHYARLAAKIAGLQPDKKKKKKFLFF